LKPPVWRPPVPCWFGWDWHGLPDPKKNEAKAAQIRRLIPSPLRTARGSHEELLGLVVPS